MPPRGWSGALAAAVLPEGAADRLRRQMFRMNSVVSERLCFKYFRQMHFPETCFPDICTHADTICHFGGGHVFCFEYNRQDVVVCAESLGFRIYKRKGLGCISFTASVPCHIINSKVKHACLNHSALCHTCLERYTLDLEQPVSSCGCLQQLS